MGGRVAPTTAYRHPELVEALVIVDSAMPLPPSFVAPERPAGEGLRHARAGAGALPADARAAQRRPHARSPSARSRRPTDGWTWKFDPRVFTQLHELAPEDTLPHLTCPVALVQGELSTVTEPSLAADFARRLGRPAPLVTMPGVHHHMMLEDPAGPRRDPRLAARDAAQNERGSPSDSPMKFFDISVEIGPIR